MKKRTCQLTFRFTEEEWELLNRYGTFTSQPLAVAGRDAMIETLTEWLRQREEANKDRRAFVGGPVRKLDRHA